MGTKVKLDKNFFSGYTDKELGRFTADDRGTDKFKHAVTNELWRRAKTARGW